MMRKTMVLGFVLFSFVLILSITLPVFSAQPPQALLDPRIIPKYVNQLTGPPPVYESTLWTDKTGKVNHNYTVEMKIFSQQILPPTLLDPITGQPLKTLVWGYGGKVVGQAQNVYNSPGPTFEAIRGIPINVKWVNLVNQPHMFAVDPTLHWANPNNIPMDEPKFPFQPYPPGYDGMNYPPPNDKNPNLYDAQHNVPLIPHLHGGEVQSYYDGHPEAWFTWNGIHGMAYHTNTTMFGGTPVFAHETVFHYPNAQPPTTLWYHDHALGITRLNVMSGLAGFYLLRDPSDSVATMLPSGAYEMPLVIQDRTFNLDGSFWFPTVGLDPSVHPYWQPEFFGNAIMVNGLVWPNMNVDQGQYRFRLLDGSNARFYTIRFRILSDLDIDPLPFIQIGSDGGYLQTPVVLKEITIAPGERADILVDFSNLAPGTRVIMTNSAKAPFPNGVTPDPKTVGQIMQFTVTDNPGYTAVITPANLPPLNPYLPPGAWPTLPATTLKRTLVLWEVMGPLGPTEVLLNGQKWGADISEKPKYHDTEEWVIVNPTADAHPIHLHLVQFQLVSRQALNTKKYVADWLALNALGSANGAPPWDKTYQVKELDPTPYLKGQQALPTTNEMGWKDTIQVNPGEVTVIRVRFEPIDGTIKYPFNPTKGPGYVWHCHILDHEDNEMMRPYLVKP